VLEYVRIIFFAFIAMVVGAIIYYFFYAEKKRSREIEEFARDNGFFPNRDLKPGSDFTGFNLWTRGYGPKITNMFSGYRQGLTLKIFDLTYRKVGSHAESVKQTVVAAVLKRTTLPKFYLAPENALHRIGKIFGFQDIDFSSYPKFSRKYLLRGKDEAEIRKAFTPPILELLQTKKLPVNMEAGEKEIIFYRRGKRPKPQEFAAYIAEAEALFHLFENK